MNNLTNFKDGVATFIMPHWRKDNEESRRHLDEAIDSIIKQTDTNWHLVIVDDCSPCLEAVEYLSSWKHKLGDKMTIIQLTQNVGSGIARNRGIEWAYENSSPILLFLDVDDVNHPDRLKCVREHFVKEENVNVVYSTFQVIDETGSIIDYEKVSPTIQEIMDGHTHNVVEGENAWISIATEKNYTNLTSATAVRTTLAYEEPFPDVRVSEDAHTWLRYGAHKGKFVYDSSIPSLYRIPCFVKGDSASRDRLENFYERKIKVDMDGFMKSMAIAKENGNIKEEQQEELLVRFYIKLAETMVFAKEDLLGQRLIKQAEKLDKELAIKLAKEKRLL